MRSLTWFGAGVRGTGRFLGGLLGLAEGGSRDAMRLSHLLAAVVPLAREARGQLRHVRHESLQGMSTRQAPCFIWNVCVYSTTDEPYHQTAVTKQM